MEFRWIQWNLDHVAKHGVPVAEAEAVVESARRPYPRKIGDDKWLVIGRTTGGRIIQVVFVEDDDESVFIIHARPLTEKEKRRWKRAKHG